MRSSRREDNTFDKQYCFLTQSHLIDEEEEDDLVLVDPDSDQMMSVSVRGIVYKICIDTVDGYPGTRLHRMSQTWEKHAASGRDNKVFYIDRNPLMFNCILDYYLTGELHMPDGLCPALMKGELSYWGIGPDAISTCCLWKARGVWDTHVKMQRIIRFYDETWNLITKGNTWRTKLWQSYKYPFHSKHGIAMYVITSVLYSVFLATIALQTFTMFREPLTNTTDLTGRSVRETLDASRQVTWLSQLDFILLCIITVYHLAIFLISPEKGSYLSFPHVTAALGVAAQWVPVVVVAFYSPLPTWLLENPHVHGLKTLRILPVFSMLSPYKSSYILRQTLHESRKELALLCLLIVISSVMFGYLIFMAEISEDSSQFRSIPDGFWWGVVTLTTVGYGDMYPQTSAGRIVGVACAVVGILVVALPVPIISGNFTKIYELVEVAEYHNQLRRKEGVIPGDSESNSII